MLEIFYFQRFKKKEVLAAFYKNLPLLELFKPAFILLLLQVRLRKQMRQAKTSLLPLVHTKQKPQDCTGCVCSASAALHVCSLSRCPPAHTSCFCRLKQQQQQKLLGAFFCFRASTSHPVQSAPRRVAAFCIRQRTKVAALRFCCVGLWMAAGLMDLGCTAHTQRGGSTSID